jgi:hypothetical protein
MAYWMLPVARPGLGKIGFAHGQIAFGSTGVERAKVRGRGD